MLFPLLPCDDQKSFTFRCQNVQSVVLKLRVKKYISWDDLDIRKTESRTYSSSSTTSPLALKNAKIM